MNTKENEPCNPRNLHNVLIVRFSAIGDVAMTVPSVYDACLTYPNVRFIMLTRPSMVSIFANKPDNLVVIGADLKKDYKGLSGMRRIFSRLRHQYKIDGVVDLHDTLRTKYIRLIASLMRIPCAHIHKGKESKRALTRHENKVLLQLETTRSRYRNTFSRLGLPLEEHFDGLYPNSPAPSIDYSAISGPLSPERHWIGIAPFAKHQGKIYPIDLMEEVVKELSSREDVGIFLFGGGDDEKAVLANWASHYPRVRSLAGERYGFGVELALLSNLDCMLSMDSANMHLASLVGSPVVSVWGATHPYCGFKGWRQSDSNMIQLPLTCRPCSVFGDKPCYRGDYLCLSGIKPRLIVDKIFSLLDSPDSAAESQS